MVDGGMAIVKYSLFVTNFVFGFLGVILLVVGSITQYYNRIYVEFVGYKIFVIPIVIIGLGTLVFFINILGCCGSIRENYVALLTFAGVLMGVCLAEATLTLVAYMSRFELTSIMTARVQETMKHYPVEAESMSLWDSLQRNFNCCGTLNYTDWSDSVAYYRINNKLPQSCCGYTAHSEEVVTFDLRESVCSADSADLYIVGCLDKLRTWINKNSTIISVIGLVVAGLQVFGILFSCCLARRVKRDDERNDSQKDVAVDSQAHVTTANKH